MFELNNQKTLEAYTTTTMDLLALTYQLSETLITASRCSKLANMTVITIAASPYSQQYGKLFRDHSTRVSRKV